MPIKRITIAEPFFGIRFVTDTESLQIDGRCIVLNLGQNPIRVQAQGIASLRSVIVQQNTVCEIESAIVVDRFEHEDEGATMAAIRKTWPTAFAVRAEQRLQGVAHYMSPKTWIDRIGLTFYHAASVPLNVGLHREHPFCPVPGYREVHTQIMGVGKMQQCRKQDISTLYLEEVMAPGYTHSPMFDAAGNYPWHQFETVTPGVFMAVEMLPQGATPPELRA